MFRFRAALATNPLHLRTFSGRIHPVAGGKCLQMTKEELERYLSEGLTLREIGERTGKHLTTVGYWMKRHGLRAPNSRKFAPKRSEITKPRLEALIAQGASLKDLAEVLQLSVSTVRHWLQKYELQTSGWGGGASRLAVRGRLALGRSRANAPTMGSRPSFWRAAVTTGAGSVDTTLCPGGAVAQSSD